MTKLKIILIAFSLIILNTSCLVIDSINSPEFDNRIHGSGVLITEERSLPYFNSVQINTSGKVFINRNKTQQVSVAVDSNVIKYVYTTVSNGKLNIGIKSGINVSNIRLTIDIGMNDLAELRTTSSGDIFVNDQFVSDAIVIATSSSGDISLDIKTEKIYSNISSSGDIFLNGSADEHRAYITSSGDLHAFNLATKTTKINISSSGDAEVSATNYLEVTLSSSGSLYYKGNPSITYSVSSSGKIYNANGAF